MIENKALLEIFSDLKEKTKEETLDYLKERSDIPGPWKNLIYLYCFPKNLGDYELPERLKGYTEKRTTKLGTIDYNIVARLIEAYRTPQYSKYIRHLIHAFIEDSQAKVFPLLGEEKCKCGIYYTDICQYNLWEKHKQRDPGSLYLAYASKESSITLSLDAMIQLGETDRILNVLEPDYLNGWKKKG